MHSLHTIVCGMDAKVIHTWWDGRQVDKSTAGCVGNRRGVQVWMTAHHIRRMVLTREQFIAGAATRKCTAVRGSVQSSLVYRLEIVCTRDCEYNCNTCCAHPRHKVINCVEFNITRKRRKCSVLFSDLRTLRLN